MKEQFLHFIVALIVGILYGYLTHDLMNGIQNGVLIGIGFVIGDELIGKRREKKKGETGKHKKQ